MELKLPFRKRFESCVVNRGRIVWYVIRHGDVITSGIGRYLDVVQLTLAVCKGNKV